MSNKLIYSINSHNIHYNLKCLNTLQAVISFGIFFAAPGLGGGFSVFSEGVV